GLLVHGLDVSRQPGCDARPVRHGHVCRDPAGRRAGVHHRSIARSGRRDRALSLARADAARRGADGGGAAFRSDALRSSLTAVRYFHRLRNMKTIARLPLAQLTADETHVEAFKALAHLSRLQVFFLLVKAGREMTVGEIQGATLSHHLDILRRAGLLESRKEERYIYYSVQRERVSALVRLLTACC